MGVHLGSRRGSCVTEQPEKVSMSTGYRIHGRCGTWSAGPSSSSFLTMATIND